MLLEVCSEENNVVVSIYDKDKEIEKVMLKKDEAQHIDVDDTIENVEVKFSRQHDVLSVLINALLRLIIIFLDPDEELIKLSTSDFISTHIPVKENAGVVLIKYTSAYFWTAKRTTNIGFVEDDSSEAYYTLDEKRFRKIEKHEIIEVFLVGMVMCTVFWIMLVGYLLEHRYDLLFLPIACIVGGFIILFSNLKNTRDISLIDKFKVDLKYKDFRIDGEYKTKEEKYDS